MAERIIPEVGKIKYARYTLPATRKPYLELYKNKTTSDLKEMYIAAIAELEECVNSEKKVQLRAQLGAIEEILSERYKEAETKLFNKKVCNGELELHKKKYDVHSNVHLILHHANLKERYRETSQDNIEKRAELSVKLYAMHEILSERTQKELEIMTQEMNHKYGSA